MILSIHIPKTAGTTFGHYLRDAFGSRLILDYGDLLEVGDEESVRVRQRRKAEMLGRADELRRDVDAIHGHYHPSKYEGVFAEVKKVTFVRDPYQHAISSYLHAARSYHGNKASRMFRSKRMNAADLVQAFPDHQSSYLADLDLDEIALIGISEDFRSSIALFRILFSVETPWSGELRNVNPAKSAPLYDVPADVRRAVDSYRSRDIALYRLAQEQFAGLVRKHLL